jgi:hypothetical protein
MRLVFVLLMACGAPMAVDAGVFDSGVPDAGTPSDPTHIDFQYIWDDSMHACYVSAHVCEVGRDFDAGVVRHWEGVYADAGCLISSDGGSIAIDCTPLCPDAGQIERPPTIPGPDYCCPSSPIGAPIGVCDWNPK